METDDWAVKEQEQPCASTFSLSLLISHWLSFAPQTAGFWGSWQECDSVEIVTIFTRQGDAHHLQGLVVSQICSAVPLGRGQVEEI
jgi:hypothetical protein